MLQTPTGMDKETTVYTITRLPYEVVTKIFTILVCTLFDNPVRLLLVCKYWNEAATSISSIWSNIIFGDIVAPLDLEEIWNEMASMVRCSTVSGLVHAINRTGRSKFRLTVCAVKYGRQNTTTNNIEASQLHDPTCFEKRCYSLRLLTRNPPMIIASHLNKLSVLEELAIPETWPKVYPINNDFFRSLAYGSPNLREFRCIEPGHIPEFEIILPRLKRIFATDAWIAKMYWGRRRKIRSDDTHACGSPTYPSLFNPQLEELEVRRYGEPSIPTVIRPETLSPPTPPKLTISFGSLIQNPDTFDRITHLTLRRCRLDHGLEETVILELPLLTHLRLAGCKYPLGCISAPNVHSLQIYQGTRVGLGTWPRAILVRPKVLDIHWNTMDRRLLRLLECEWKGVAHLTLVIQSLKREPHKSLEGFIDAMTNYSGNTDPNISVPIFFYLPQTPNSSDYQRKGIICPHLGFFTILILNPGLSSDHIDTIKQTTEIQAKRLSEARRYNGVFKGARIGWHAPFARSWLGYVISETGKWGMEWKEFI